MGDAVGKEVEEYIARYTHLRWNRRTIPTIYDEFQTFGPIDRDVLLMRLANELEDLQELGVLYCFRAEGRRRHYMQVGPMMIDMAQKLGCAPLAAELERVLGETAAAEIPVQLRCRHTGVALIAPRSYRRQASVAVYQELVRGFARLRSIIRLRTRLRQFVYWFHCLHAAVRMRRIFRS